MKFETGEFYEIADGGVARIDALNASFTIEGDVHTPAIRGVIQDYDGRWRSVLWSSNGKCFKVERIKNCDLVKEKK